MTALGIYTQEQYLGMGKERRYSGARVAYNLLDVGENPTEDQTRIFEDISFTMQTSNGTFRTSFRNRFQDVNAKAFTLLQQNFAPGFALSVQDRAVSHGLTSCEWAQQLFPAFPAAAFEASDLLLSLLELRLATGEVYITERNGVALQYIKPPYVVGLHHPESWRKPLLRWMAMRARGKFQRLRLPDNWKETTQGPGYTIRSISCIHPETAALMKTDARFRFRVRSVFDRTPAECNVIRTMNIFNRAYFPEQQLAAGAAAIFDSLQPGGIWIVGRTMEDDFTNQATFFLRGSRGWEVLDRLGKGSEVEALALRA